MELKNRTILITGGTSGIGLEFVKQLTEQGAKVLVTGRKPEALHAAKQQFPTIEIFQSDVSKAEDIERLYAEVTGRFPELSMIVNNAGLMRLIDLQDETMDLENINREIATNLSGTIWMAHTFLPHLKKQKEAAIVNVSSAIAYMGYSVAPIYSASKAAVHTYSQMLRLQLQQTAVRVIEIVPPGVNTALQDDWVMKPNPRQMMNADNMVRQAVRGILKDKSEIRPGLSGVVRWVSRIAPKFLMRFGNREFEKFQQLSRQ